MSWMWISSYRKMLSIQKDSEFISTSRVVSQEHITFGTEAAIVTGKIGSPACAHEWAAAPTRPVKEPVWSYHRKYRAHSVHLCRLYLNV